LPEVVEAGESSLAEMAWCCRGGVEKHEKETKSEESYETKKLPTSGAHSLRKALEDHKR